MQVDTSDTATGDSPGVATDAEGRNGRVDAVVDAPFVLTSPGKNRSGA
jgi:hypothetical protein